MLPVRQVARPVAASSAGCSPDAASRPPWRQLPLDDAVLCAVELLPDGAVRFPCRQLLPDGAVLCAVELLPDGALRRPWR